ncbi:MAG: hypothetical protein JWP37_52 [Mucilaginibacter sp.]|nr:hypothetical protein [Mucilaginibacter sp.]
MKSTVFSSEVPKDTQLKIKQALDTLIYRIQNNKAFSSAIDSTGATLSETIFGSIKGVGIYGNTRNDSLYSPQLINLHAIGANQYFISVAYIGNNTLKAIVNFEAAIHANRIIFSIPLFYLTRNWKIKKVGRITYHYADNINMKRAAIFNKKNTRIAKKLGLPPENFDFYLVDDYFDILKLLGYAYDSETAGHENDGFGPVNGYIFSIMHNEDFSHDVFHYYADKVRTHSRNSAAEEGIAYSWGNAYYTDEHGEMISQGHLVKLLKQYLLQNPNASLLDLFNKNPSILPSKTKVRSLLASLISDEVERRKGISGIKALIDCGHGDDNYFKVVNQLIGINVVNFNVEEKRLLDNYN